MKEYLSRPDIATRLKRHSHCWARPCTEVRVLPLHPMHCCTGSPRNFLRNSGAPFDFSRGVSVRISSEGSCETPETGVTCYPTAFLAESQCSDFPHLLLRKSAFLRC